MPKRQLPPGKGSSGSPHKKRRVSGSKPPTPGKPAKSGKGTPVAAAGKPKHRRHRKYDVAASMAAKALKEQKQGKAGAFAPSGDASDGDNTPGSAQPSEQALLTKKQRAKLKAEAAKAAPPRTPAVNHRAALELAAHIAQRDAAQQAAWLWESFSACTGASYLEKEGFQETSIARLPQDGSLEHRLKSTEANWRAEFCGAGADGKREPGLPSLLIIGPSAVGVNGLIKQLPAFAQANKIGKLFAKHFKVDEQAAFLAAQPCCVAVGTPNRLAKLADMGALKLDRLKLVVVDVHLDQKQRTILDIPETRGDFWAFIKKHCQSRMAANLTRIALINSDALLPQPQQAEHGQQAQPQEDVA